MSQMTEQNAPRKRDLALVSRSTYLKEKALQYLFSAARSWPSSRSCSSSRSR